MQRNYYTIKKSDVGNGDVYCFGSWWLFGRIFGRDITAADVGQRLYMTQPGQREALPGNRPLDDNTTLMIQSRSDLN